MAIDTKQKILDTAELAFAEHGYSATSLRTITREAGVNLASVNYHFRSKEELFKALLARRLEPMNRQRLAELEAVERAAAPDPPPLEAILEAFMLPIFRLHRAANGTGETFLRLVGLMYSEAAEVVRSFFFEQLGPVALRFSESFHRALPHLPKDELFWRMYFSVGAMAHTLRAGPEVSKLSGGVCDPSQWEATAARLIRFLAAAMRAPL